jgi:hypothetical protein
VGFTEIDRTGEADVKESNGDDDEETCGPEGDGKPKSDGGEGVKSGGIVGRTTERLGDNLPDENDKSEDITCSDPQMALVSWRQLLKVRKTEFGLETLVSDQHPNGGIRRNKTHWGHPSAQGMRGKNGNDDAENDEC